MKDKDPILEWVRPAIRRLMPYSSARSEYEGAASVWLDANENPKETAWNRYPDPQQKLLKSAITEWKGVPENQIFLGNGSDEIIDLVVRVFCEPRQDKIMIMPPTYGMYEVAAAIQDAEVVRIPLTDEFQIDLPAFWEASFDPQIKVLFLCSPNNPTGNQLKAADIEQIIRQFNGIVVLDEAYIQFGEEPSFLSRIDEFPNLLVMQTMSKAMGLAAVRLGMAFGQKNLLKWLNAVKPPYNLSGPAQKIALEAVQNYREKEEQVQKIIQQRNVLAAKLDNLSIVNQTLRSHANFLLILFTDPIMVWQRLSEAGIIVRNRTQILPGALRITVGTEEENNLLLEALNKLEYEKSTVY